ncbi:unnamed protein product [Caenorhabditis sp. 36 PRJEB53466]|nr:unnamed protein product [Caenorhabditis sp. 36 PRJEB53466]
MSRFKENAENNNNTESQSAELLVLDLVAKHTKNYKYIASYKKDLFSASIPPISLKKFGRNSLQFGTVLNGNLTIDWQTKEIRVDAVKCIYMLTKAKGNKWAELQLEFCEHLKKNVIRCSALTNGCFTYMDKEYSTPAVFNDVLGVIVDSKESPRIPSRQIGRLVCLVTTEQTSDGPWQLRIESVPSFEAVLSLAMTASSKVAENEHFGLVTREECEVKRDLRLVSSRDFPRDVRIFRSGSHCCESIDVGHRPRRPHLHSECMNTCVGEVNLIGKCMAFQMKRCLGMSSAPSIFPNFDELLAHSIPPSVLSSLPATSCLATPSSEGRHVDSRSLRADVTQLEVHVHGGFVEVETIAEYSGYTDHNGLPLLWSHDVEFVVDISGIFNEQNKGLYTVKVVRFHRMNVFAKWRLARRNPILKAMQTRFHSQEAHSITLANLSGIRTISLNDGVDDDDDENEENRPHERQRLPSFSRFGNSAQSCCLPRTDSLDNVELFEALVRNESTSSSAASSSHAASGGLNSSLTLQELEMDDDSMWMHHDSSVLKIVEDVDEEEEEEDGNASDTTLANGVLDENSNDVF